MGRLLICRAGTTTAPTDDALVVSIPFRTGMDIFIGWPFQAFFYRGKLSPAKNEKNKKNKKLKKKKAEGDYRERWGPFEAKHQRVSNEMECYM